MGFEEPRQNPITASAKIDNLELMRIVYETIRTGKPTPGEIKLGAGVKTIVEVLSTPMRDANGKHTGILLLLTDMTRVRKLETVRQDFVGNVAHELRTPITSISGFAELLTHTAPEDGDKIPKYSAIILRQSKQMMMIIDDLLTLASLDNHDKSFEDSKQESSIAGLVSNAVELCNERIQEKNADIVVACDESLAATVHAGLMEQAVVNLIDNAVKYGISDVSKRIEVTATRNEGVVNIKVTDHGNGIPQEHLERIFERFYRIDKGRGREQGGTGLGLAIVKHIMQLHEGSVSVESRRGERTCFTLMFPADKKQGPTGPDKN
jgi:two-component system phosphate regulon sensor histidine kinase PhoR